MMEKRMEAGWSIGLILRDCTQGYVQDSVERRIYSCGPQKLKRPSLLES